MIKRLGILMAALLGALLVFTANPFAQNRSTPTWPEPPTNRAPAAEKDKKPAPKRNLVGMWGARANLGNQAKGVQLHPNDGKPEKPAAIHSLWPAAVQVP